MCRYTYIYIYIYICVCRLQLVVTDLGQFGSRIVSSGAPSQHDSATANHVLCHTIVYAVFDDFTLYDS